MAKYDRQKVIDIALAEVGYKEKASRSNLDSKTANAGSGNITKYWVDLDALDDFYNYPKQGQEWCDGFNDWCHVKAYGVDGALYTLCQPKESCGAGCAFSYNYYKAKGRTGTAPRLGAQAFFQQGGKIVHTGLVVAFTSSKVTIVEGNASNMVKKNTYSRSNSYIYGYGYPRYDDGLDSSSTAAPSTNTAGTSAAISGKIDTVKEVQLWLNNTFSSGLNPDGLYGRLTKAALVKALQKTLGVDADGEYGPITNAAVKKNNLRKGDTGTLVKILQAFLVCNGYKAAYVDGEFGSGTYKALRSYQDKMDIAVDGIAGSQTFTTLCS